MNRMKLTWCLLVLGLVCVTGRTAEAGRYWVSGYAPVAPVYAYPVGPVVTTSYYAPPMYVQPVAPAAFVPPPVVVAPPVIAPTYYERVTVRPWRGVTRVRGYWGY